LGDIRLGHDRVKVVSGICLPDEHVKIHFLAPCLVDGVGGGDRCIIGRESVAELSSQALFRPMDTNADGVHRALEDHSGLCMAQFVPEDQAQRLGVIGSKPADCMEHGIVAGVLRVWKGRFNIPDELQPIA
jgi:hypothetical protein